MNIKKKINWSNDVCFIKETIIMKKIRLLIVVEWNIILLLFAKCFCNKLRNEKYIMQWWRMPVGERDNCICFLSLRSKVIEDMHLWKGINMICSFCTIHVTLSYFSSHQFTISCRISLSISRFLDIDCLLYVDKCTILL